MTNEITSKVLQLIDQVQHTVVSNAPAALNATLQVIRINSIQWVLIGLLLMIISATLLYVANKTCIKYDNLEKEKKELRNNLRPSELSYDDQRIIQNRLSDIDYKLDKKNDDGWFMGSTIFGFLFFLLSLPFVLDIWNWVGTFSPKLELAHQLISKFMG